MLSLYKEPLSNKTIVFTEVIAMAVRIVNMCVKYNKATQINVKMLTGFKRGKTVYVNQYELSGKT